MKRLFSALLSVSLILCVVGKGDAVWFEERHDYDQTSQSLGGFTWLGEDFVEVLDFRNYFDWYDTFVLDDFDPAAVGINWAELTVTHWGNISTKRRPELWIVSQQATNTLIGQLSPGCLCSWTTDTFSLSDGVISEMMSHNPWQLALILSEETGGLDLLKLDEASVYGDYQPVPEPTTVMLLGTGLVGFAVPRLRKKVKK